MMMSTLLVLTVAYGHKEEIRMMNGEVVKFKYPTVVADHYMYKGGSGQSKCIEA